MKKILLFLLVPVLLAASVEAITVYRYDDTVTTTRGDAIYGATVTVYEANTSTLATIYSTSRTSGGEKSNPTSTDSYGRYHFFVEPGVYDITISGTYVTSYTMEDVHIDGYYSAGTGVFNVMDYGATGDGTTDDTAFIQAAIDSCKAAGSGEVYFPPKTFRTTGTITVENLSATDYIHINLGQATVVADTSIGGPIIQLGDDGVQSSYDNYQHRNIDLTGGRLITASRNWNNTVGLRLVNLVNGHIRDVSVHNCEKGIELSAITSYDGTSYNSISFRQIGNCLYAIYIENDYGGWCMENYFYGDSRVSYSTSLADVDCSGGAGFYAKPVDPGGTSEWEMNMLTVSGISLEFSAGDPYWETNGHKAPPAMDLGCTRSTFTGVRTEGWNHSFDLTGATKANPCVVTLDVTAHGIEVDDYLYFSAMVGMTELDYNVYQVTAVTDTTVTLDLDASGFGAAGTDGVASFTRFIKTTSDRNFFIGGNLPGADIRAVMSPVEWAVTGVLGGRTSVLSGGHSLAPVLELRAASSGYRVLEVSTAAGTTPTLYIEDNGSVTFVPRNVPSSPDEGTVYFSSALNKLQVYTGNFWETVTSNQEIQTASADDTTPSVSRTRTLLLPANTGATAITSLDWGGPGQIVTLVGTSATNSSTIADGGNFNLTAGWTAAVDASITLLTIAGGSSGASWIELGRSAP